MGGGAWGRGAGRGHDVGGGRRPARARGGPPWAWRATAVEAVALPHGATGVGGGDVRRGADNVRRAEMIFRVSEVGGDPKNRGAFK